MGHFRMVDYQTIGITDSRHLLPDWPWDVKEGLSSPIVHSTSARPCAQDMTWLHVSKTLFQGSRDVASDGS